MPHVWMYVPRSIFTWNEKKERKLARGVREETVVEFRTHDTTGSEVNTEADPNKNENEDCAFFVGLFIVLGSSRHTT